MYTIDIIIYNILYCILNGTLKKYHCINRILIEQYNFMCFIRAILK